MRLSQYSEEQIIAILKEAEAGKPIREPCRQHGFTDQTYYRWKAKYGGLEANEARRPLFRDFTNQNWHSLVSYRILRS